MKMSKEQKLLALLLCDIHKALKIEDSLVDAGFISGAIIGGHDWALDSELEGQLIPEEAIPNDVYIFVTDVLDMHSIMEDSYERLSDEDKKRMSVEAAPFGGNRSFMGFDGNNEHQYRSVCSFLIKKMQRFTDFHDRANLNSHSPTLDIYQRMLDVFLPNRAFPLSVDTMIEINRARFHPEHR